MMYKDGDSEKAKTYDRHMELKKMGFNHEGPFKMNYSPLQKKKGLDGKACWKGYTLRGTKKKGNKTVDNCVKTKK